MLRKKTFIENTTDSHMSTILRSGFRGKTILDCLNFEFPFAHAIHFYIYSIDTCSSSQDYSLGYFAGSGTTTHALQLEGDVWKVRLIEEMFMKRMWEVER